MHARLWGLDHEDTDTRIRDLSTAFGLSELIDRSVGTYSGGERRRLEIARALLSNRRSVPRRADGRSPIRASASSSWITLPVVAARQMTNLLTTHYPDEAEQLCDRSPSCPRSDRRADTPVAAAGRPRPRGRRDRGRSRPRRRPHRSPQLHIANAAPSWSATPSTSPCATARHGRFVAAIGDVGLAPRRSRPRADARRRLPPATGRTLAA